jgi:hypothetical protein
MRGVEEAVARGTLAGEDIARKLARIQSLRASAAPRRVARLAWPAHARLARRAAAAAATGRR